MRSRILLAGFVAVVVGLVIGTVASRNDGRACRDWQEEYASVSEQGRGGVFTFVGEGPIAERLRELEAEQPDGCPKPGS